MPDTPGGESLPPALYLVATPIGNAGDIGGRALAILGAADLVACEDTRVTGRFFARLGIAADLVPYHEHNAQRMRPKLMERLKRGESVALVSDAGTPLVSDPGYKLVEACVAEDIPVTAVPGPSSVLAALTVSGLPTDRFLFAGFLPGRGGQRKKALDEVAAVPATLVFLESAKRLAASLADMADVLGPRPAAVARELTKRYEEVRRGPLADLAAHYAEAGPPKGEIVVVVGPPPVARPEDLDGAAVDALLRRALETERVKDAAAAVARETGLPRKVLYARALELKDEDG